MKKLIILFVILGLVISLPAYAADVVITITIPEAQVSRVQAAVLGELHCKGANAKDCLKGHLINRIKELVRGYENTVNQQNFSGTYQDLEAN